MKQTYSSQEVDEAFAEITKAVDDILDEHMSFNPIGQTSVCTCGEYEYDHKALRIIATIDDIREDLEK